MYQYEFIALMGVAFVATIFAYSQKRKYDAIKVKYSSIENISEEVDRIKRDGEIQKAVTEAGVNKIIKCLEDEKNNEEACLIRLKSDYKEKKEIYDRLIDTISIFDEEASLIELGLYKPHYDFGTSEEYKSAIENIREKQKAMVSSKTAILCGTEWSLNNSKSQGQTMTNRAIRLTARAFNNECEAVISNTRWNNAAKMEQRIIKSFETINKLNESNSIFITQDYLLLKLQEFRLAFEYQEKKHQEREEQSLIRQRLREEEKLLQDVEKAKKEEEFYQKLLNKAMKDCEKATGEKLNELESEIARLTIELDTAHEKSERARSMAEQTKAGHVYIISNIGSFGENVFKIGMTRRLDPTERIYELGNASVPFVFDIHAMIYSEDAPALENRLHKAFDDRRINQVNSRKEFFRVGIDEIRMEVFKNFPEAAFVTMPEARQYRETQILNQKQELDVKYINEKTAFPQEI